MRVVVSKIGSVFYGPDMMHKASPVGDMGDTEGVVRGLISLGHDVCFYGSVRGTVGQGRCARVVEPDLRDLDEMATERLVRERLTPSLDEVHAWEPEAYVQVCGYAPTMSHPWNKRCVTVQAAGVRYALPVLMLTERLKLPRLMVNNDPRSVPREQEMTECWPELIPAAMLSQWTRDFTKVVGRKKYDVREVYSGAEHWAVRDPVPGQLRTRQCTVVSHCHIGDGTQEEARDEAWRVVFKHDADWAVATGIQAFGQGWEHFSGYNSELMPGVVKPAKADMILAQSKCGPIVSIKHGFYTGKMRTYLLRGCLPLLWGRGEECTYDSDYRYVPHDSELRWQNIDELKELVRRANEDEAWRGSQVEQLLEVTAPDYSRLKSALELQDASRSTGLAESAAWWSEFGGFRPCRA